MSLTYVAYNELGSDEPSLQDCEELGRDLRRLRQILEELELHIELYTRVAEDVENSPVNPIKGHLQSLREFIYLRSLHVPTATLLGWTPSESPEIAESLPRSLKRLILSDDLAGQCTYQWTEESVLEKLKLFLATVK
ncbi:hypothetical protein F4809DRAFT_640656 [Biscogniauxia mediterranea]|nr:hypothetical protein F4809DRAFT_640656 [Biscogniauxia mediterranea]